MKAIIKLVFLIILNFSFISVNAQCYESNMKKGKNEYNNAHYEQAKKYFTNATKCSDCKDKTIPNQKIAECDRMINYNNYLKLGKDYYYSGKYETAKKYFQKAKNFNNTYTVRNWISKCNGTLQIKTNISGSLYIDGSYKKRVSAGNTYTISDLTAGTHQIKIGKQWQTNVRITAGQTKTIRAENPKGTLQLTANVSGNLYIDDILEEYISTGTYTDNDIAPGSHTAEIKSSGVSLWKADFTIYANQTTRLTANNQQQPDNTTAGNYTETAGGVNMDMVFVKGGTFQMGSNDSEADDDEQPVHSVTVSDFYIGKYEVTNEQFCQFLNDINANSDGSYNGQELIDMDDSDCAIGYSSGRFYFKGSSYANDKKCPVIEVTWYGANEYCKWLSRKTGETYRLPTEAEWEYAARGGVKTHGYKYSGSNNIDAVAWYWDNSGKHTHPVGTKSPNELGIYDMSGNVWEWCSDWYSSSYYSSSPSNNPQGHSSGSIRVNRGGSWYSSARNCRVANRSNYDPTGSSYNLGFRVVRAI